MAQNAAICRGTQLERALPREVQTLKARYENRNNRLAFGGLLVAIAGALSSVGCYKATFVEDPSAAKREPTHEEWTDHYVFGLVGEEKYDVNEWCPSGAGAVRTGGNAGTTALTIVTIGIYAPRKVYVTCDQTEVASSKAVSR